MNKKVIIFGTTCFSIMLAEYVEKFTDDEVVCFTINEEYIKDNEIMGLPVIGFENIEKKYNTSEFKILNTVGYKEMNTIREKIFYEIEKKGFEVACFIHPSALINANEIGTGNIILENVFIGPHTNIGNGNIIWNGVNISHDGNIGNFNCFGASTTLAGNVTVRNNCFFGINSSVKNELIVADKTLLGAGCFLNKNTKEEDVYITEKPTVKLDVKSSQICHFII